MDIGFGVKSRRGPVADQGLLEAEDFVITPLARGGWAAITLTRTNAAAIAQAVRARKLVSSDAGLRGTGRI